MWSHLQAGGTFLLNAIDTARPMQRTALWVLKDKLHYHQHKTQSLPAWKICWQIWLNVINVELRCVTPVQIKLYPIGKTILSLSIKVANTGMPTILSPCIKSTKHTVNITNYFLTPRCLKPSLSIELFERFTTWRARGTKRAIAFITDVWKS